MKGSNNYTAQDIERYHSGQLSFAERHALEKAALDDPFLADALEGYAFAASPAADLSSLQHRLQNRIDEKEKRRSVFMMNSGWMKVAALLVLMAGIGWFVFKPSPDKNEIVAVNQSPENKNNKYIIPPATDDSTVTVFNDVPVTEKMETVQNERSPERLKANNGDNYKPLNGRQSQVSPSTFSLHQRDSIKNEIGYDSEDVALLRKEKSYVSDSLNNATAVLKDRSSLGNSTMRDDTVKNFDVVLKNQDLPLSEVVIVNKGVSKPEAKRRMQVIVDTLEPAEGWTHFDDYIANNLKEPEELKSKPVSGGEVELAFEVNKQGEPINITVTKSLCDKCDEEAIRLLKEGPKWKKKVKKGKVKIRF